MQSPTGPGGSRARLQFIDLLRGWAVIFMIQTHMLNATLRNDLRGESTYRLISFFDGLVAPSFIFASGFVFAVALRRKLPDYLSFGPALGKQFGRLLFVLALGYMLHMPVFSLRRLSEGVSPEAWTKFWAVDVLQCISVSLLLVLLLLLIVRTERRLFIILPWVAGGIAFLTPVVWSLSFSSLLPVPIAAYLNAASGSQFPLFPWSVFLLSGVITGGAFAAARARLPAREGDDPVRSEIWRFTLAGVALLVISFVIQPVLAVFYPPHDFGHTSPAFVLLRLGLVLLLLSLCYAYERRTGVGGRSVVTLVGRESLLVYAAHLQVIYASVRGFSFRTWVDRSFGYAEVLVATVVLIGLMMLLSLWWDSVRRGDRRRMRLVQGLALAGCVIAFLISPG